MSSSTTVTAAKKYDLADLYPLSRSDIVVNLLSKSLASCPDIQQDLIDGKKKTFAEIDLQDKQGDDKTEARDKNRETAEERRRYLAKCGDAFAELRGQLSDKLAKRINIALKSNEIKQSDIFGLLTYLEDSAKKLYGTDHSKYRDKLNELYNRKQQPKEDNWTYLGVWESGRAELERLDNLGLRTGSATKEAMEMEDCRILVSLLDRKRNEAFLRQINAELSADPSKAKDIYRMSYMTNHLQSSDVLYVAEEQNESAKLAGTSQRMHDSSRTKGLYGRNNNNNNNNTKKLRKNDEEEPNSNQGGRDLFGFDRTPCVICWCYGDRKEARKHVGKDCPRMKKLKELDGNKNEQQGKGKKRNKHNGQGKKKQAMFASPEEAALAEYLEAQKEADPEDESD